MLIFKSQAQSGHSEKKFAGFFIDQQADLLLTLASISEGISKSEVMRRAVDDWCKESENDDFHLVKAIAKKAFEIFEYKNKYETAISIDKFQRYLEMDLVKKKVPINVTMEILRRFDVLSKNK